MPIYLFQCSSCAESFEFLQKMSDPPQRKCPKCHTDTLVQQVTSTHFQLKGTGWYVTDFKDKGAKQSPDKKDTSDVEKPSKTDASDTK